MKSVRPHLLLMLCLQFVAIVAVKAQVPRQYYTNKAIAGNTEDARGANCLLLQQVGGVDVVPNSATEGKRGTKGKDTSIGGIDGTDKTTVAVI